jgi:hypothetical protein
VVKVGEGCIDLESDNSSFSLYLINGLNRLECSGALGYKCLPWTNTLAFWAHLQVTKIMKCCEYSLRPIGGSHQVDFNPSLQILD